MPTLAECRRRAATLRREGDLPQAVAVLGAIAMVCPQDFRSRLQIGDAAAAMGDQASAVGIYRSVGHYCLKAGHPLMAFVAAKVIEESFGGTADDLLAALVLQYGVDSELTGPFAARLRLPPEETEVELPATHISVEEAIAVAAGAARDDDFPEVVHPIPLLSNLSDAVLRRVVRTIGVRRLPADTVVIREGEPGQSFFFVADGDVEVYDTDSMGSKRELAHLGPGSIFGEMALLSAKPRTASVVTTVETDLLELSRESLAALAEELEAVGAALREFTYERMLSNLLRHNPLFRPFTGPQRRELLKRFTSHDVAVGTPIIHQGDLGTGLFVVLSGAVEVVKTDSDGAPALLATLRSGDVFGEMALLGESTTTATVTAIEAGTVLFLAKEVVERMIQKIPAIRDYLEALADDRALDTQLALAADDDDDDSIVILF